MDMYMSQTQELNCCLGVLSILPEKPVVKCLVITFKIQCVVLTQVYISFIRNAGVNTPQKL